ncbi:MAG: amino acid transporter [Rhodobacterales bacterium]|nr:MAG: amino acid transporter [Rhodobacterales bacterium]
MTSAFINGFLLSISLILAIGAQNAFVLRQGLRGEHVLWVVLTCALSDALLISAGVAGFATLSGWLPQLAPVMRYLGAAFLIAYGALNLRAAWRGGAALAPDDHPPQSLARTLAVVLALTWLNPHVYLDTVLLIGSVSTKFEGARAAFGAGAVSASFVFFFALGYGAALLRPLFARPVAWRVLDIVIGLTMWAIAAGLIFAH